MSSGASRVLIIGCGPSGAAAATTLAHAGVECVVLDRASFPRDKTCGDALSNEAVSILGTLGAADQVLGGAHAKVRCARAVLPNGQSVSRNYDPPGIIVTRVDLDDALRSAAQAAGAALYEDHAVRELIVESGRVVGARGEGFEWRAEIVITADGHGSIARSILDHPKSTGRYLGVARTAYLEGVHFDAGSETADHYFEHDLPYGYGWVFPEVAGRVNVGIYQRSDYFEAGAGALDRALDAFLDRHPERFCDSRSVGKRRSWPLPLSPAPWNLSAPGLLAVGDAGNHIDPLSGEGIWQALRSGQLAAQFITAKAENLADDASIGRDYAAACELEINRASRKRARIQAGMKHLVSMGLYRLAPVRWVLGWGYGRQSMEATKSLS